MTTRRRSLAFSVIELLLVVALIGVLVALLFPTIARIRARVWDIVSMSNVRTHTQSLASYALDWDDAFVHFTRPDADATILGACGDRDAYRYFANSAFWYLPLAESYYGSCQAEPLYIPSGFDEAIEENRRPWDYFLTSTAITTPAYWNLETRTGRDQWGTQRFDQVRFASAKAVITESAISPLPNGDQASRFIGLGMADGSAGRFSRIELTAPIATGEGVIHNQWIFVDGRYGLHTPDGLLGRDVSRTEQRP
ncbi:MAG: type II secretion system protein [Phycisphaeraceae bacterium]|nr:MAG: type II secretion system protein [Phycisphaeraceae bacterium]